MHRDIEKQEAHWDRYFEDFDQIYSYKKSRLKNILDKIFRKDIFERFRFVFENSEPIEGKVVLDAGCGSGRFAVEFARRKAKKVTGIDISGNMIKFAQKLAKETRVEDVCDFHKSSILEFQPEIKYDLSIAIGVLDYIKDPLPLLAQLGKLSQGKVILSFPRVFTWRAPIRKLRLFLQRCDVYFYSKSRIKSLLKGAGLKMDKIKKVGKLYCVVACPNN
jgi:2-polyprenyl-3-methyl-5-hydroxy-6-metoxy-1,4-benzoquinol methylase